MDHILEIYTVDDLYRAIKQQRATTRTVTIELDFVMRSALPSRVVTSMDCWRSEYRRGMKRHGKEPTESLSCPRLCPRERDEEGKPQTSNPSSGGLAPSELSQTNED
jgi:hypothetical protein